MDTDESGTAREVLRQSNDNLRAKLASQRERSQALAATSNELRGRLRAAHQTHRDQTERHLATAEQLRLKLDRQRQEHGEQLQTLRDRLAEKQIDHSQQLEQVRSSQAELRQRHAELLLAAQRNLESARTLNGTMQRELNVYRGLGHDQDLSAPSAGTAGLLKTNLSRAEVGGLERLVHLSSRGLTEPHAKDSTIVIAGCPRSGTTLLQAMLCSHVKTWPLTGEAAPVTALAQSLGQAVRYAERNPSGALPSPKEVEALFVRFVTELLDRAGHEGRAVLKHPLITAHLTAATALLRSANVVIVRDPRAVFSSARQWGARAAADGKPHPYHEATDQELCLLLWGYLRPLLRTAAEGIPMSVVRYEALTEDPQGTLSRLARELQLDDEFDVKADWESPASAKADRAHVTDLYGASPSTSSAEKWKVHLTKDTQAVVESSFRQWIEAFERSS